MTDSNLYESLFHRSVQNSIFHTGVHAHQQTWEVLEIVAFLKQTEQLIVILTLYKLSPAKSTSSSPAEVDAFCKTIDIKALHVHCTPLEKAGNKSLA